MLEQLVDQPPDGLLALISAYRADERPAKIDLGVGVYRDAAGKTPVPRAVKEAERLLLAGQDSKSYLGPEGDQKFVQHLIPIVFGEPAAEGRHIAGVQTPGGTGALRLGAELLKRADASARLHLGLPSWPNHAPLFKAAGLALETHRFVDLGAQSVDFAATATALEQARPGDIVLLHGCCHNPTGLDFTPEQRRQVAELIAARKLVPFIDLAYQGLGDGLEPDAAFTREILAKVDEALVAYSCDKNFGLYRDRVGALFVATRTAETARKVASNMAAAARVTWSMPPDHGAAAVRLILESAELTRLWRDELDEMQRRIKGNRTALAEASPKLGFVAGQRGLFSNLSLSRETAVALRRKHAIYLADSGRINLAGMQPAEAPAIVAALEAEGAY